MLGQRNQQRLGIKASRCDHPDYSLMDVWQVHSHVGNSGKSLRDPDLAWDQAQNGIGELSHRKLRKPRNQRSVTHQSWCRRHKPGWRPLSDRWSVCLLPLTPGLVTALPYFDRVKPLGYFQGFRKSGAHVQRPPRPAACTPVQRHQQS